MYNLASICQHSYVNINKMQIYTMTMSCIIPDCFIYAIATVTLVGFADRTGLFCRSNDLLESVRNATPFCVITGI